MDFDSYQYDSSPSNKPSARHTKFLDLTNGEGGERHHPSEEEDPPLRRTPALPLTGKGSRGSLSLSSSSGKKVNANTPGKVVDSGQEHTGRWTKEEHEAFLSALKTYGKEWKKVAAKVKTRTVVQTRTHAQKYFQKLQKAMESTGKDELPPRVEMGYSASKSGPSSQKKKQRLPAPSPATTAIPLPSKANRQSSVTSAAHLISNLSASEAAAVASAAGFHHRLAAASIAASPFALSGDANSLLHGFSTFSSGALPPRETSYAAPFTSTYGSQPIGKPFPSMSIKAPEHDAATKRGKFPEPSPAACGKRKLAEIAAARMLAGVAASSGEPSQPQAQQDSPALFSGGIQDGTTTPPPEEEKAPTPPTSATKIKGRKGGGMGLSLQIVNPETLGISYEEQQKRRRDGQASPVTPWEGQLNALVRYVPFLVFVNVWKPIKFS